MKQKTNTTHQVFLGLGGNIGDSCQLVNRAFDAIKSITGVSQLKYSALYLTSPVSTSAQRSYVNAACSLQTSMRPKTLFTYLERIEKSLGKQNELKEKDGPRIIDIDMLHYDMISSNDPRLTLPHPLWNKRLFVVVPLLDLTSHITLHGGVIVELGKLARDLSETTDQLVWRLS